MRVPTHAESVAQDREFDRMHTTLHDMFQGIITLHTRAELLATIMRSEYRGSTSIRCPICSIAITRS